MQCHLPPLLLAAATDQSKVPKDNGGQLPRKVMGPNGPDQSNNNNGRCQMGGGTTRMALQSQKVMRNRRSRTGTTIKLDYNAMQ
jgi:hypothetical protein